MKLPPLTKESVMLKMKKLNKMLDQEINKPNTTINLSTVMMKTSNMLKEENKEETTEKLLVMPSDYYNPT